MARWYTQKPKTNTTYMTPAPVNTWQTPSYMTYGTSTPTVTPTPTPTTINKPSAVSAIPTLKKTSAFDDLVSQYTKAISGMNIPKQYAKIEKNLGIPDLQTAASNLTTTIANLPKTSLERAQRYDLSQGQMQEYQAGQESKLAPTAASTYGALTSAEQEAQNQLAAVQAQYGLQLQPYSMAQSLYPSMLAAAQPISVGASTSLYDPVTRQIIYKGGGGGSDDLLKYFQSMGLGTGDQNITGGGTLAQIFGF
jgi:hypothetical protein